MDRYVPVNDGTNSMVLYVPKSMKFKDDIVLLEQFVFRGRDVLISRTVLPE
ncbi:MAG: hypothetical protein GX791_03035 [Synergistaceae bacterium]|nr:hypothetical protein [Synergistaceae bacterium]